ncbi:MAG: glutathione S-transferase family protein [Proteobacteria bacterium]|jgi:glutathione S-transferase|nr:glutathione S-transferase family protein [Pseudomonadota bacterium]TDI60945.1 MAG: glutathione S-transferase family protein [Alphaproteobacteria bacterium]
MLKIYGFDFSSPANKVRMCANALGLEYEYIQVNMQEGEHKSDKYLAVNPAGKVPAIDDDGFTLFESNAIMKYFCDKSSSSYYPKDPLERAVVDQWCDFVSIHVYMALGRVVFNKIVAPQMGFDVDERSLRDGQVFLGQFLPVIEGQLGKTELLAGDELTIADFCLLATVDPAEMIELDLTPYPKLNAWRENLRAQEFYQNVHKFFGESMMAAE